jgi:hypothetical protein
LITSAAAGAPLSLCSSIIRSSHTTGGGNDD